MRALSRMAPLLALAIFARLAEAQEPPAQPAAEAVPVHDTTAVSAPATPAPTAPAPAASAPAAAPAAAPAPPPAPTYDVNAVAAGVTKVKQATKMIVYPAKQQTAEQQARDEQECYVWAEQQTKIDPMGPGANVDSAAQASKEKMDSAATGAAVGGAARGAAGGAAVGAIAGDAGEGAAIGAVAGAVGGRRAKKQAKAQAEQAGAAQAQAVNAESMATFKKAMAACLQGRNYTVQ